MIEIGRICVKIAGRDAGKRCVIVDVIDDNYVLVDGETRRRKSNIMHLEPLDKTVEISKNASHEAVTKAVSGLGWELHATKAKKATSRPRPARKSKLAATTAAKTPAKAETKPATAAAAKPAPKPRAKKAPAPKAAA